MSENYLRIPNSEGFFKNMEGSLLLICDQKWKNKWCIFCITNRKLHIRLRSIRKHSQGVRIVYIERFRKLDPILPISEDLKTSGAHKLTIDGDAFCQVLVRKKADCRNVRPGLVCRYRCSLFSAGVRYTMGGGHCKEHPNVVRCRSWSYSSASFTRLKT
jgi:hypothetical protein